MSGYVAPLAAIGASLASSAGRSSAARCRSSAPIASGFISGLVLAVFTFCMAIVGVFILSLIINALAPTFGGEQNSTQALKVAVYSYTPAWIAGVLQILPLLGIFAIFAAFTGLYLLYLGLPRLMKCPEDKAAGVHRGGRRLRDRAVGRHQRHRRNDRRRRHDRRRRASAAPLGVPPSELRRAVRQEQPDGQAAGARQEARGEQQEDGSRAEERRPEARRRPRPWKRSARCSAAASASIRWRSSQLKAFVPDTFAGLPKTRQQRGEERHRRPDGLEGRGPYGDGAGKTRDAGDLGHRRRQRAASALASWAGVEGEKDDDSATEKTRKGRRPPRPRADASKRGGRNEFGIVLGDRFVVSAKGDGISVSDLKAAISSLDLAKLESMSNVGVQK